MRIDIEGEDLIRAAGDPAAKRIIRSAAYFLLAAIGDIPDETEVQHTATGAALDAKLGVVPTGTNAVPPAPPVAPAATAPAATAPAAANTTPPTPPATTAPQISAAAFDVPPPPPPPSNVGGSGELGPHVNDDDDEDEGTNTGNAPPPPPGLADTAGASAAPSSVTTVAAAPGVVSAEADAAGLPWDERIHQKGKSKKKDNTWKLKKGIDPAVVVAVTAELAARKGASAPVSLPVNSVSVPPVPNATPANSVPAPNSVGSSVPVPPAPPVGGVGASDSPYRKLIDKITDLTKAGKLTPTKVSEICTSHGSPSLMALKQFEALIPAVDKDIDAAALGLM